MLARFATSYLLSVGLLIALPAVAQDVAVAQKEGDYPDQVTAATGQKLTPEFAAKMRDLPDSPGATQLQPAPSTSRGQAADNPWLIAQSSSPGQSPQEQSQQPPQAQTGAPQSPHKQEPVGTAAAEAPKTTGIAASQPAGLAIAPGKQHRVRTIILRTGAIIGAGVAVGTVIALTEATSSKPPGAH
jgi:hypothetical protein